MVKKIQNLFFRFFEKLLSKRIAHLKILKVKFLSGLPYDYSISTNIHPERRYGKPPSFTPFKNRVLGETSDESTRLPFKSHGIDSDLRKSQKSSKSFHSINVHQEDNNCLERKSKHVNTMRRRTEKELLSDIDDDFDQKIQTLIRMSILNKYRRAMESVTKSMAATQPEIQQHHQSQSINDFDDYNDVSEQINDDDSEQLDDDYDHKRK